MFLTASMVPTLHKKEFETLVKINDEKDYLAAVNVRGRAKNSDHYYFTEKNVPAFFRANSHRLSAVQQ